MLKKVIINGTLPACVSKDGIEFLSDVFNKVEIVEEAPIENGMWVFWPAKNELGYYKAFVKADHIDKFTKNGASLSIQAMSKIEEPEDIDPFEGMKSKEITKYVLDKTGEEISNMGSLDSVKKRAIECLKQHDK